MSSIWGRFQSFYLQTHSVNRFNICSSQGFWTRNTAADTGMLRHNFKVRIIYTAAIAFFAPSIAPKVSGIPNTLTPNRLIAGAVISSKIYVSHRGVTIAKP